jgi:hypothetical protein
VKPRTLKGLVHLGLALVAVGELFTATSRTRKVLLGSMAGFHAHAILYHFIYEDGQSVTKRSHLCTSNDGSQQVKLWYNYRTLKEMPNGALRRDRPVKR